MQIIPRLKKFFFPVPCPQTLPQLPPAREDDFPHRGQPHWRRSKQVFEALDQTQGGTYTELINYVKQVTGKGCSKKLVAKWKRERGFI